MSIKYINIIYSGYLDNERNKTIGGVQTYISDLSQLFEKNGLTVRIFQFSNENFEHDISDNIKVFGFKILDKKAEKRYQMLYDRSVELAEFIEQTITIFASDIMIPKKIKGKCIAIQHGIFWDVPREDERHQFRQIISRDINSLRIKNRIKRVDCLVCVDYNFLNWYRTQVDCIKNDICVIPNYTNVTSLECIKSNELINIIFARRFFKYRGTRVFVNAIRRIFEDGYNIRVTIAGSGPDEDFMKSQLKKYKNVIFTRYESKDSLDFHLDKHIAVVPTIGSEGTSLSLLEAMSAQCAVICTDVGGMTNIVIDGYNGIMVNAGDENQLYKAIKHLLDNEEERFLLAKRAYETVSVSFSHQKWSSAWISVLDRYNG